MNVCQTVNTIYFGIGFKRKKAAGNGRQKNVQSIKYYLYDIVFCV